MAKKKGGKKMQDVAEPEVKTKPVRLDLEPDEHRLLRMSAARAGRSMAAHARAVLVKMLEEEVKRGEIKP
jgi:hypothetical protein